eukprot:3281390-Pleurochrysis_carterae.AAC.1
MSTASNHVPKSQIKGSGHTLTKGTRRALFDVGRQAKGGRTALLPSLLVDIAVDVVLSRSSILAVVGRSCVFR